MCIRDRSRIGRYYIKEIQEEYHVRFKIRKREPGHCKAEH